MEFKTGQCFVFLSGRYSLMNKKIIIFPVFFLLLLLIRFFLFPRALPPEPGIERSWAKSIPAPEPIGYGVAKPEKNTPISFRLGDVIGYFRRDGTFLRTEDVLFSAAMDDNFYCNFGKIGGEVLIMDYLGRIYAGITAPGYPMIRKGRFFMIATNRGGLSEYNKNGELLWIRKFNGFITDVDVSEDMIAVGLSSGTVHVLGDEGGVLRTISGTPGRIPVVYGCALSEDTGQVGVLSGIDPQTVGVYSLDTAATQKAAEHLSGTNFRRRVFISFIKGGTEIVYESGTGITLFDPRRKTVKNTVIPGRIRWFSEDPATGLLGAAFSDDSNDAGMISLISPEGNILMTGRTPDSDLYIRLEDGFIFVGSGNTMAAFLFTFG
jgi:hypothetical protein